MNDLGAHMKSDSYLLIEDVLLPVQDTTHYYWMDEITISQMEVEIERILPALPNKNVVVENVRVEPVLDATTTSTSTTSTSTTSTSTQSYQYDVEINPLTCLYEADQFPLFGIDGAEIDGLNFDGSAFSEDAAREKAKQEAEIEYLNTHDAVVFTSSSWGSGTVSIERIKRGSVGLKGSYSLSYMGKTVENMPMDMTYHI